MDVHYVPNLRVRLLALVIVLLFIAPATAQAEGPDDTSSGWVGAGIALANLVYIPFKLGAAAFGTTVSGLAFLATFDREVASPIFWSTVGGDWVVTPNHIEGSEPFRISGAYRTVQQAMEPPPAELEPFEEAPLTEFEG